VHQSSLLLLWLLPELLLLSFALELVLRPLELGPALVALLLLLLLLLDDRESVT
jgi:hypothetical protein